MKAIGNEYDTQEQALAVCYAQLKQKEGSTWNLFLWTKKARHRRNEAGLLK